MPRINKKSLSSSTKKSSTLNDDMPNIHVPFPPNIDPRECINLKKNGTVPLKSPNCFILYRLAFYNELRAKGFIARQKIISKMVSSSWKKEPLSVKKAYKDLARETHVKLIELRRQKLGLSNNEPFKQELNFKKNDINETIGNCLTCEHASCKNNDHQLAGNSVNNKIHVSENLDPVFHSSSSSSVQYLSNSQSSIPLSPDSYPLNTYETTGLSSIENESNVYFPPYQRPQILVYSADIFSLAARMDNQVLAYIPQESYYTNAEI
ncbi:hypothetical protein G9A89_009440 [Geosiphon pyriformis]|nr:hypothetical protein G9A89_009440 [Geosiphon pyriformis]